MSSSEPVFQLAVGAHSYEWGKIGSKSPAARYAQASPGFVLDESKPYAELWMGTHLSLPSRVLSSGVLLSSHLDANAQLLGNKVIAHFGKDLPFLFKVLAIEKALSIQAHPDKKLAAELHRDRPTIYKDGNHKPEMAIAITPFQALCGFRSPATIANFLRVIPELRQVVGNEGYSAIQPFEDQSGEFTDDAKKTALRSVFRALMNADSALVKEQVDLMARRFKNESSKGKEVDRSLKELAVSLDQQFPGDVGVFCIFFLNVISLNPSQAIFLQANEPHAYLSGDIIECMATSDNVVRAGLTPKLRDVDTLISMLTYTSKSADQQIMPPIPFKSSKYTTLYDPPIEEFSVLLTDLPAGEKEVQLHVDGPSIFIITRGNGEISWDGGEKKVRLEREGVVFFVGADTSVEFTAGIEGLVVYRAFVESPGTS